MSDALPSRMTASEFLAWAQQQSGRYELVCGEVVAMAPERAAHNLVKYEICRAFKDGVRSAELTCQVFTDGMAVRIDDLTVYEPDATVRCGSRLGDDAIEFSDPIVVVEVLSPSTQAKDAGAKLSDYFRLPSVSHYLIVRTDTRTIIHHARDREGTIITRIVTSGRLSLDPPGLGLGLDEIFAELES